MAYRNEVQPLNLFNDFIAGQQAGTQNQANQQINALRGQQIQRGQRLNALSADPTATPEQLIRAGDAQTGAALQTVQDKQSADKQAALTHFAQVAQRALAVTDPQQRRMIIHQGIAANPGALAALGGDPQKAAAELEQLPDAELEQRMQAVAQYAPAAPIQAFAPGSDLYQGGQKVGSVARDTLPADRLAEDQRHNRAMEGRQSNFTSMTPDEIAAAGLPPGTSAQRDAATGKIDVITKRDTTGVLSQKDAAAAKNKLTAINLAINQLARVKEAFQNGTKGVNAFGGAQGYLPTQAGKLFDGRVDQIRSTITSLTRTPGIGSMSDYETKLDQGKLPSRSDYESVTADKIAGLEDMLALLKNGYSGLLTGGNSASAPDAPTAPPAQPAAGGWAVKRVK